MLYIYIVSYSGFPSLKSVDDRRVFMDFLLLWGSRPKKNLAVFISSELCQEMRIARSQWHRAISLRVCTPDRGVITTVLAVIFVEHPKL